VGTVSHSTGIHLEWIDYAIVAVYYVFVLGIGFHLKKSMKSSRDFLQAGRGIPSWVTGLAFLSANLGAIEVMGMAANGAQYGMMTCHFYWLGAIPAMVFVAVYMMPFYYKSNIRSVPEYLRKRFNEPTRALNAISFAVMTVLMSGINLYAMALVFKSMLHWDMNWSIFMAAMVVLAYTITGGLTSSIYNEVMQFFLIFFGLLPVSIMGVLRLGDWNEICARFVNPGFAHLWLEVPGGRNPMGADFLGLIAGLGFVLSFGYWCTDFLVIQRALAAKDLKAAQMTPIIAAFPKILFPILTVFPGLIAIIAIPQLGSNQGDLSYNMAIPLLLGALYPSGLLGLGITALLASFMSGMAGNVTAFNTVWTFDIYQSYIAKNKSDAHYLWMGKAATAGGIIISVGTAYLVMSYASIMDYMQLIFTFFNAPLFATFLLGMFFKRTTGVGAFIGLLSGTAAAAIHYILAVEGKLTYKSQMISNFHGAVVAWTVCFIITIMVSYLSKPKAESELKNLCFGIREGGMDGATAKAKESIFAKPGFWGIILLAGTVYINYLFF
jgi:SSS family solute:Na+ symporter